MSWKKVDERAVCELRVIVFVDADKVNPFKIPKKRVEDMYWEHICCTDCGGDDDIEVFSCVNEYGEQEYLCNICLEAKDSNQNYDVERGIPGRME